MSEPLIGPSQPLKVWTPNEDESVAEQASEVAAIAHSGTSEPSTHSPMNDGILRRAMVALWVVCVVAIQVAGFVYRPFDTPENEYLFAFWLGGMWAGWAAAVWASSRWASRPLTRVVFLIVMFAWHAVGMSAISNKSAAHYVVMLGSYGLVQAVVFHWMGIPKWRILRLPLARSASPLDTDCVEGTGGQAVGGEPKAGVAESIQHREGGDVTRQFGIGDLIAATTVVAILITAGKSYETLLGDGFWWGLVAGEAVLLAVAVLSVMGGLAARPFEIVTFVTVAVATGVGGSFGLESIESMVTGIDQQSLWPLYSMLMVNYAILMVGFATLSMTPLRTQVEQSTDQSENEKGDHEAGSRSPS